MYDNNNRNYSKNACNAFANKLYIQYCNNYLKHKPNVVKYKYLQKINCLCEKMRKKTTIITLIALLDINCHSIAQIQHIAPLQ